MADKITGNRAQTRLRRHQMDFLCEFRFQLVLLNDVDIRVFDSIKYAVCDLRIMQIEYLFTTILIIERYSGSVLDSTFEIVNGNIATEGTSSYIIARQQRCAGKSDTCRCRKQLDHIIGKDTVLAAVRLVRHDDNVVVGIDRRFVRLIEFLYQRKYETRIAFQFTHQVITACCYKLGGFCFAQRSAIFKGIADLLVQFIPVGQNDDRRGAGKLSAYLLREENHRIALAGALGMPENAQLAVIQLPCLICFYRLIDTEILMVTGKYLCGVSSGVVKENKVFKEIEKVFLLANAAQHGFQCDAALFFFVKTLPFMEEFILAAEGTDFRFCAVGEHQKGVVIEQMRDRILIIGVIVCIGILYVNIIAFQFYKQERQTVDEAHNIGAAAVQITMDPQFLYSEEVIVHWILKIDDSGFLCFRLAVRFLDRYWDTVTDKEILLFVDLQKRRCGEPVFKRFLRFDDLSVCNPRVEPFQGSTKIPNKQNILVRFTPESAILSKYLSIICEPNVPAQLIMQQVSGALLHENVFRIIVAHSSTSYTSISPLISFGSRRSRAFFNLTILKLRLYIFSNIGLQKL